VVVVPDRSLLRRLALVLPAVVVLAFVPVVRLPRAAARAAFRSVLLQAPGLLRAPVSFRLVGVSWPRPAATPRAVRVRTSVDGRRFTAWTELDTDGADGPDGSERTQVTSTAPVWVGRARFVDVRWTGRMPAHARIDFIDPGPDPISAPASAAEASPARPTVISRAQWGADESIRRCCPEYAEPLQMVFVHHTATGNAYRPEDSKAIVRSIYTYHVKTNGWTDIGYNVLVDQYGQIFEGRYGGLDRSVVGAHSLGFNGHSSGIAVIGTFGSVAPPARAMNALKQIVAWRMDRANIDPLASTTMTSSGNPRYRAGTRVALQTIAGHRDVYVTDCPGDAFYRQLPSLRTAVAPYGDPKLFAPRLSAPVITPNGDGVADDTTLTARFSSSVLWTVTVVDPSGTTWLSASGSGSSLSVAWNGKDPVGRVAPHDLYSFVVNAYNTNGSIATVAVPVAAWQFPDGTLFRTRSSGWIGLLVGQKLRHLVSTRALETRYADAQAISAPETLLGAYPRGAEASFRPGTVVRVDRDMWIISDGGRRPVSQATLVALGYNLKSVIDTPSSSLASTPQTAEVTTAGGYPNGTGLQASDGHEAMLVSGQSRPFVTSNVRKSWGIRDVDLAGPANAQVSRAQDMPPIGFQDGTLVRMDGDAAVYVISNGLRRHITSGHRFDVMGYRWANVRIVTASELAPVPEGAPID